MIDFNYRSTLIWTTVLTSWGEKKMMRFLWVLCHLYLCLFFCFFMSWVLLYLEQFLIICPCCEVTLLLAVIYTVCGVTPHWGPGPQTANHTNSFSQSGRHGSYSTRNFKEWLPCLPYKLHYRNRAENWLIPNKTFKISNGTHSSMTRDTSCNQMRKITFILMLGSDSNYCAFHQSQIRELVRTYLWGAGLKTQDGATL